MATKLGEDWYHCNGCGHNMPMCGFNKRGKGQLQNHCKMCVRKERKQGRHPTVKRLRLTPDEEARAVRYLTRHD